MSATKVRRYVISCSSDVPLNQSELYVFGDLKTGEYSKQVNGSKQIICQCRRKNQCLECDAEVHEILIERSKQTLKQFLSHGKL